MLGGAQAQRYNSAPMKTDRKQKSCDEPPEENSTEGAGRRVKVAGNPISPAMDFIQKESDFPQFPPFLSDIPEDKITVKRKLVFGPGNPCYVDPDDPSTFKPCPSEQPQKPYVWWDTFAIPTSRQYTLKSCTSPYTQMLQRGMHRIYSWMVQDANQICRLCRYVCPALPYPHTRRPGNDAVD